MSPDEATLAVGEEDGTVRLWDLGTGRLRARLKVGVALFHTLLPCNELALSGCGSSRLTARLQVGAA